MKRVSLLLITGLLFSSCAFIFYNYRGVLNTEFTITNNTNDTTVRYQVGKLIYRLSTKTGFYNRFKTATYDSLCFYGPDYHRFRFKLYEADKSTKIHLVYFGYHGFRSRPPHKLFIQALRDSLKTRFGAIEIVTKEMSNERKK